jgi:hypothetical protein
MFNIALAIHGSEGVNTQLLVVNFENFQRGKYAAIDYLAVVRIPFRFRRPIGLRG